MNSAAPAAAVCSLTQSVKVTHIFPKGALGRIFFSPSKNISPWNNRYGLLGVKNQLSVCLLKIQHACVYGIQ